MRRSKLERQNRETERQRPDRYAMFAEEFGDIFEEIFDKDNAKDDDFEL
jgi:hypothetical protein